MAVQTAQATILPDAAAQQAADLREAQTGIKHLFWMQRMMLYGMYGLLVLSLGGFAWTDTKRERAADEARKDRARIELKIEQVADEARKDRARQEDEARRERARLEAKIDRLLRERDQ